MTQFPSDRRWIEGSRAPAGCVLCCLAASAGLSGCGNADSLPKLQVYEVKGKVLLADGKPLPSGWISFVPKGGPADHSQREDRLGRNVFRW